MKNKNYNMSNKIIMSIDKKNQYDYDNPVSYSSPTLTISNNTPWVKFGKKDNYPDELIEIYQRSSIHSSIIQSKVRMMFSLGLTQDVDNDFEWSDNTESFMNKVNEDGETLNDIYNKLCKDFRISGMGYLEVRSSKDGNGLYINHIPFNYVRWGMRDEKGKVIDFYYSKYFGKRKKNDFESIKSFNYNTIKSDKRQILVVYSPQPGMEYYTLPDYHGCITEIKTDILISEFDYDNIDSGLIPLYFFGFPVGEKSEEEMSEINDKLEDNFNNKKKKYITSFFDAEGENQPIVEPISSSSVVGQYQKISTQTLQKIVIGHGVTNENLVGISTPGKLGNNTDLRNQYNTFYYSYIVPEQQVILRGLNYLLLNFGYNPVKVIENNPYSYNLSEATLKEILSVDELRAIAGYDPVEKDRTINNSNSLNKFIKGNQYKFSTDIIDKTNYIKSLEKANMDDEYLWQTSGKETCPSCKERNGISKPLRDWILDSIPGCEDGFTFSNGDELYTTSYDYQPYGSFCEGNCNCKLKKI